MTQRSFVLFALVAGCGGAACPPAETAASSSLREPTQAPESLQVEITSLDSDGRIPMAHVFNGFGCTGENRSPAITWSGAPEGTQSYALIMHDPDAPTGVGFFHWIVTDIPASTTSLEEGAALPEGTHQLYTDFGANGYGGPCPPPGAPHRYEVTIYALDVPSLGAPDGGTGALARFMLAGHTLAIGRASGTFGR
ncbi:MAG: YbhB/YbcL family Raf kinase inhibitor-like protein [Sandaracinaceae bacterium]|nr:YbhB/YbcL family Raf kinase inhibitor-like protein [Sandaracinaceae bacterium]